MLLALPALSTALTLMVWAFCDLKELDETVYVPDEDAPIFLYDAPSMDACTSFRYVSDAPDQCMTGVLSEVGFVFYVVGVLLAEDSVGDVLSITTPLY